MQIKTKNSTVINTEVIVKKRTNILLKQREYIEEV